MSIFQITTGTKKLLSAMLIVSSIGITIAYYYYDSINKAEDPRVTEARYLLKRFDKLMDENDYLAVFSLLDQIENIYKNAKGYENSYEMGVVYNNRTATYLILGLYESSDKKDKKKYLRLALDATRKSIDIYEKWLSAYGTLTEEELYNKIKPYFTPEDLKGCEVEKIIKKRVDDIKLAQIETKRRLSVSYTNLGIIQRHQYKQQDALKSYAEALKLWPDNHTAKNNLNVLLGKPIEKISVIDKIFTKDRRKE